MWRAIMVMVYLLFLLNYFYSVLKNDSHRPYITSTHCIIVIQNLLQRCTHLQQDVLSCKCHSNTCGEFLNLTSSPSFPPCIFLSEHQNFTSISRFLLLFFPAGLSSVLLSLSAGFFNHSERSDILKGTSDQHNQTQLTLSLYLYQTPPETNVHIFSLSSSLHPLTFYT